jgi:hypothetical protein
MNRLTLNRIARAAFGGVAVQVGAALASQALLLGTAYAQKQVVAPNCGNADTFQISADGKTCVPKEALQKAAQTEKPVCDILHGTFTAADGSKAPKCEVATQAPTCPSVAGITYSAAEKQCVREASTPVSDPTNYVHDCIKRVTPIKGAPSDRDQLYVSWQSKDGSQVDLVPAEKGKFLGLWDWACDPIANQPATRISVEELVESGALRSGWVYGMLVAPFKFYPSSGEITASATIGPYLGWRMERPVGTMTVVGSAGISSVSAAAKDENNIAKTVPLTAWSAATGLIFEVSKGKSPFRVGLLVGKDWVDRKSAVKYENNGHTWLALQLGFDFTDR